MGAAALVTGGEWELQRPWELWAVQETPGLWPDLVSGMGQGSVKEPPTAMPSAYMVAEAIFSWGTPGFS